MTFPVCNNSERGTLDVTYANGGYAAVYRANTSLNVDCSLGRAWSCSRSGYQSASDQLTASQWRDALHKLLVGCLSDASATTARIDSSNSISGTGTFEGTNFSFQLTRAGGTAAPVVVQPPAAPQMGLTQNGTTVRASWNAVAGATAYTLFYAPYPNAEQIGQIDMGAALEVTATLPSGSAFYIAVQARNSAGNSGYSNIDYFVIP